MANLSLIRTIAKEKKISLKSLSNQIGITENGMQKILKSNITTIDTLERISSALGVSPAVFFEGGLNGGANAYGDHSTAINGNDNITIPQQVLEMLAEKDLRIKELTDKLLSSR